jgi:hypothetical protein
MRSNVFYLAPPSPAFERIRTLSPALRLRLRLISFWYRLRLTTLEVTGVLRRFGRPDRDAEVFLDQPGDFVLALRSARVGPARIIDFAAARERLRS